MFLANNDTSGIKEARFCINFLLLENCAKYSLDTEPKPEPEPEPQQIITGTVPQR
jgi:hypothetical protein